MQQIMRIGNDLIPADDDIKDIGHASTDITDVAHKYKTDVMAVISKGDTHSLVTRCSEKEVTELGEDILKIIALVQTTADAYDADALDIVEMMKIILTEE